MKSGLHNWHCTNEESDNTIQLKEGAAVVIGIRFFTDGATGIDNEPEAAVSGESNVLVAYFSWSGNGQQMARWISVETGGDLFRIVPLEAYGEDEVFRILKGK